MITIIQQPATQKLMAAYRPIISVVQFDNLPYGTQWFFFIGSSIEFYLSSNENQDGTIPAQTINIGDTIVINAGSFTGTFTVNAVTIHPTVLVIGISQSLPFAIYGVHTGTISIGGNLLYQGVTAPKVVYCDVYIQGLFYKTFSKTQPSLIATNTSQFEFDIQDVVQEYIKKKLYSNGGSTVETDILHEIYCKFRGSTIDLNGFLVPDTIIPIQATGINPPVAGTGTQGNTFFGINATLQHEDNQDLATHLNTFKNGTWNNAIYPLTHRPAKYKLCKNDSDFFPIINIGKNITCLRLNYKLKGSNVFLQDGCGSGGGFAVTMLCNHVTVYVAPPNTNIITGITIYSDISLQTIYQSPNGEVYNTTGGGFSYNNSTGVVGNYLGISC